MDKFVKKLSPPLVTIEKPQPREDDSPEIIEINEDNEEVSTPINANKRKRFTCDNSDPDDPEEDAEYRPSLSTPKSAKKTPRKKPVKIDGRTVEQHRRALGDAVKANIQVEKWTIEARTHVTTECSLEVFKALVVPNAEVVHPRKFDANTEVILAEVENSQQAAAIFGSSKITGGTRCGSWRADKMDLIFKPKEKELRVWWTMR